MREKGGREGEKKGGRGWREGKKEGGKGWREREKEGKEGRREGGEWEGSRLRMEGGKA